METSSSFSSGPRSSSPSEAYVPNVLAGLRRAPHDARTWILSERYLFGVTALFLLISVGALAFRYRERRGIVPAVLGLSGAAAVLIGKFHFESIAAMYTGLSVLIAASLWNSWPKRSTQSCPQCAPGGDELIQLSAKGR